MFPVPPFAHYFIVPKNTNTSIVFSNKHGGVLKGGYEHKHICIPCRSAHRTTHEYSAHLSTSPTNEWAYAGPSRTTPTVYPLPDSWPTTSSSPSSGTNRREISSISFRCLGQNAVNGFPTAILGQPITQHAMEQDATSRLLPVLRGCIGVVVGTTLPTARRLGRIRFFAIKHLVHRQQK